MFKLKTINYCALLIFSVMSLMSLMSCSKEKEISLEDKIVGSWSGELNDDNYGTIEITLDISKLVANQFNGDWTTEGKDDFICNCGPFKCTGPMAYLETKGNVLRFSLTLDSGPCYGNSIAEISFIDDNTINYKDTESDTYTSIQGVFKRK